MTGVPRLPGPASNNPTCSSGWEPFPPQWLSQPSCESHCPNPDVPPDSDTIPSCFPQPPPTTRIPHCLPHTPTPPNSLGHHTLLLLAHHLCCVSLPGPAAALAEAGSARQQQQAQAAAASPAPAVPPAAPSECHMARVSSAICWLLTHHGASWAGERQAHVNHPSCPQQASMSKVPFLPATHISCPLVWAAVLSRSGTSVWCKRDHAGSNGNTNCVWNPACGHRVLGLWSDGATVGGHLWKWGAFYTLRNTFSFMPSWHDPHVGHRQGIWLPAVSLIPKSSCSLSSATEDVRPKLSLLQTGGIGRWGRGKTVQLFQREGEGGDDWWEFSLLIKEHWSFE